MQIVDTTSSCINGILESVYLSKIKLPSISYRFNIENHIDELSNSIAKVGLLHPITVRPKDDYFEIVAGSRRYLACRKIGWKKIICHVLSLDDKHAYEISLIENIHSETLNPIEEGYAFKNYISKYGWGGASNLAEKIGKSTSYVTRRCRLLTLPSEVITDISNSYIDPTIAEELLPIKDKVQQSKLAELIKQRQLTSKQVRILRKDELESDSDVFDFQVRHMDIDDQALRSFDKLITTLKLAAKKTAEIIDNVEDNWTVYEILMQHKHMLDNQIDILIKEKKKL